MEKKADLDPPGGGMATILVVDDETVARDMFTDVLESQGFRVLTAGSAEEVFPWLEQADLVLLDAMLPGRDGWSICREIKEQYDPFLPVIMVTARTGAEDVLRTFSAGADDYVAKPFQVAELTARIETRLRVRRAEQALQQANRQLATLATQNYQLYQRAKRDADERNRLLKELNHRVGNNLSIMMGLVSLERNRRPARPAAEALASLENRMRAFLLVHDLLRDQDYRGVPVRQLAENLAQKLRRAYELNGRVDLEVSGPETLLGDKEGFALALVMNELVSNAFRHAFGDGDTGTVRIRFDASADGIRIHVLDDGVGMAAGVQPTQHLGSGRSIVDAVVRRELGGSVEYEETPRGTSVRLALPRGPHRKV